MKRIRTFQVLIVSLIIALLAIPSISFAGDLTDFTGEWALNEEKSDLGEGRGFAAFKIVVKQEGNTLTIERTRTGRNGEEGRKERQGHWRPTYISCVSFEPFV